LITHVEHEQTKCDALFREGHIVDGSGDPSRVGDVAISGDRIVAIGDIEHWAADRVIDARGLILAPGFIDVHSHADSGLATQELSTALPLITQGITTAVINPDGFGPVDVAKQRQELQAHGLGINTAQLVPHGSIRKQVLGYSDRQAKPEELEEMKRLVKVGMESGAFGLSSGLFYTPACFAPTHELVALARIASEFDGVHSSHIRDESNYNVGLLTAVDELIHISRHANVPGIITHIKALGPNAWGLSEEIVRRVDAARKSGLEIWADQYPYEASSTYLSSALIPKWALEGGRDSLLRRFDDTSVNDRLAREIHDNLKRRGGPSRITLHNYPADPDIEGQLLKDIAEARFCDPVDLIVALLRQDEAGIVSHCMSCDDVGRFMKQNWTMVCTDGDLLPFGKGAPHPRCYGAFPRRIAKYVVKEGVTSLEHAIRAMTTLPAQVFQIKDRGILRQGTFADIVAFDLDTICDRATFDNPHRYTQGINHLMINGEFAIENSQVQDCRSGRTLLQGQ